VPASVIALAVSATIHGFAAIHVTATAARMSATIHRSAAIHLATAAAASTLFASPLSLAACPSAPFVPTLGAGGIRCAVAVFGHVGALLN
jgi:hypothetical protein